MAIELISKIKPKNGGNFAMVDAEDVEMPDGTRLSDFNPVAPVVPGVAKLLPDKFYDFGEVSTLAVTLEETGDNFAHEFAFEFVTAKDFNGFSVTPAPRWNVEPQIIPGKTYQVSILRGIGVMISV